jgi:threonine/homoserine/homoserine lactone efflux protein
MLVPLAVALAAAVVVPGPNVVAVVMQSMRDRRIGLWTAAGVASGDMLWAAAAMAGMGALLPAHLDAAEAAAVLGATAAIVYGWYFGLAVALSRPPAQRVYRRATRAASRVAAGIMGALGVRLALT